MTRYPSLRSSFLLLVALSLPACIGPAVDTDGSEADILPTSDTTVSTDAAIPPDATEDGEDTFVPLEDGAGEDAETPKLDSDTAVDGDGAESDAADVRTDAAEGETDTDLDGADGAEETDGAVAPDPVAPSFISSPPTSAAAGEFFTYLVQTRGTPAPDVTVEQMPDWMSWQPPNLTGIPPSSALFESVTVELSASNGVDPAATQLFELEVVPAGEPWIYDPDAPLSGEAPPYAGVLHPLKPTNLWGPTPPDGPLPTNSFWQSLVVGSGENRINLSPYQVRWNAFGLRATRASLSGDATFFGTSDTPVVELQALEGLEPRSVEEWGPMHVTVAWGQTAPMMRAPLVRGMAYLSMEYVGATPRVGPVPGIGLINLTPVSETVSRMVMTNGQVWRVYTSAPVTWSTSGGKLVASAPFTGWVRMARETTPEVVPILDAHAGSVPVGAELGIEAWGNDATIDFNWNTTGTGPHLHYALPHHLPLLASPEDGGPVPLAITESTIRGEMQGLAGTTWTMNLPLADIDWYAPHGIAPDKVASVEQALQSELGYTPSANTVDTATYWGGKQMGKLARLLIIAEELGKDEWANTLRDRLRPIVDKWLTGSTSNAIRYDETWGGLVLEAGLTDPWANFGMTYYNDHHFHYGYHVYAAAAVAKSDPEWAALREEALLAMIRDFSNPSPADPYFTPFRTFDWYEGHSWARGLFESSEGPDQESTSEAVNAHYGVSLWGLATGRNDVRYMGRVLAALETRSTQTYWQLRNENPIYPEAFRDTLHCVGVLWAAQAVTTTWFGTNPEFTLGIQIIPVTPYSEALLAPEWVEDAEANMLGAIGNATSLGGWGWVGFLRMALAVTDPEGAWPLVLSLPGYDDGNSATNTRYWVATRPSE